jgi:hypothetical protein
VLLPSVEDLISRRKSVESVGAPADKYRAPRWIHAAVCAASRFRLAAIRPSDNGCISHLAICATRDAILYLALDSTA